PNGAYGKILEAFKKAQEEHNKQSSTKQLSTPKKEQWSEDSKRRKGIRLLTDETIKELKTKGQWKGAGTSTIAKSILEEREKEFKKQCEEEDKELEKLTRQLITLCHGTYPVFIRKAIEEAKNFQHMLKWDSENDRNQFLQSFKEKKEEQTPNCERLVKKKPKKKNKNIDYYTDNNKMKGARKEKYQSARLALEIIARKDEYMKGNHEMPSWYTKQLEVINYYEKNEYEGSYADAESKVEEVSKLQGQGDDDGLDSSEIKAVSSEKKDAVEKNEETDVDDKMLEDTLKESEQDIGKKEGISEYFEIGHAHGDWNSCLIGSLLYFALGHDASKEEVMAILKNEDLKDLKEIKDKEQIEIVSDTAAKIISVIENIYGVQLKVILVNPNTQQGGQPVETPIKDEGNTTAYIYNAPGHYIPVIKKGK
ncbi:MAG: hypothetical protein WBA74_13040, partial [Cyclobacteriaceae bacterium]